MVEENTININKEEIKKKFNHVRNFLKQKKVIKIIIIILFLSLLIWGSWIRFQNLPLLKDSTKNKYIPLALDPFYFLRIAETIIEQGGLPEYDLMRQPASIFNGGVPFINEILPKAIVSFYSIAKIFDKNITLQFIDVISPVIFFALGLIAFFFLVYILTKSKTAALISSVFLTIIPTYLYRTMAGFSDHEAIGMFAFFLTFLGYAFALKFLDRQDEKKKNHLLKVILFGVLTGFLSAFTIASWGGIANLIFMIIPLSFGLFWLIKAKDLPTGKIEEKKLLNYLIFYGAWFISTILWTLFYGYTLKEVINKVTLISTSLLTGFFLLFIIIDFVIILKRNIILKTEKLKKYRVLLSFGITIIIGILLFMILGKGISSLISGISVRLLHPFGTDRVGLTVAENAQPFLNDWIGQIGKVFFWLFLGGLFTLGVDIAKGVKEKKRKFLLWLLWSFFILGLLFSRTSSSSIFNGTNFISRLFYFGSLILFLAYFFATYFKEKIEIKAETILIFSWAIFMLIAARGALRTFFVITPFACFSFGFLVINLFNYTKKCKDELGKMFLGIIFALVIIASLFSFNNLVTATISQAKYTGPSANYQWQQAMAWVRENTPENAIFVHWWDYGYWVEYLGERPTLSDGGHFEGAFRDHLIGRYLLTTPNPETALSFMRTNNVSYLLIDPTDLGKYPAYSSIGGDKSGDDRLSSIPLMVLDSGQTQQTNNSQIRVYQGATFVDENIIYNTEKGQVFLPKQKAIVVGAVLRTEIIKNNTSFSQPEAVFLYNQQQIRIPLRYIYYNGEIIDFENGLESVLFILPKAIISNNQMQVDNLGALIYLSPKVSKSLFAQLYLMNDPFNNYPTLKLAHSEQEMNVNLLKIYGADIGEFVYIDGFRGPIKIWKVDYPKNIIEREEFLRISGEYAEFDNLTLTK